MKNSAWSKQELSEVTNVERILPSQTHLRKMYKGGENFYEDLQKVLFSVLDPEPQWSIKLPVGWTYAVMGSEINTLRFYQFLINSHGCRKVLELGTYIGVSAMYMAETGAHITTIEKGGEFFKIAQQNISENGFSDRVELIHGNAVEELEKLLYYYRKFDLILIDCAKEYYKELLELSLSCLSPGGLILIDDVFFQGDTLNPSPSSEKGMGVKLALQYTSKLQDYEKVILPIGNGLLMLRKK